MHLAFIALKVALIGCVLAANAYYLLSIIAGFRFFSKTSEPKDNELKPATIMVPLYGADFKAYENYARFCRQDYPTYQIVFGVRESTDSSIPIVQKLIADFPDTDISLVVSDRIIGSNLKVSNLQNMLEAVKHEQIIVVDSDIREIGRASCRERV